MTDQAHISQRPLTVKEWERRLANAEGMLAKLEVEVARLIVMVDRAGDATGVDEQQRLDTIHSAHGKIGHLKGAMRLARRRIEKGLV